MAAARRGGHVLAAVGAELAGDVAILLNRPVNRLLQQRHGDALLRRSLDIGRVRLRRPRIGGALRARDRIRLRSDFLFDRGQRPAGDDEITM